MVLLVFGALLALGVAGAYAVASFMRGSARQARLEADPSAVVSELFDGSPQVVYAPHDTSGGLSTATLVRHASRSGYRLVSETGVMATRTLVFEKTQVPPGTATPGDGPPSRNP